MKLSAVNMNECCSIHVSSGTVTGCNAITVLL
jgi:hypothetical protein